MPNDREKLRLLVVDPSTRRRKAFASALAPTGWDIRCVSPARAHAASRELEPDATLVAYPRAAPSTQVGALLKTRGALTLVPPDAVEGRGDELVQFVRTAVAA